MEPCGSNCPCMILIAVFMIIGAIVLYGLCCSVMQKSHFIAYRKAPGCRERFLNSYRFFGLPGGLFERADPQPDIARAVSVRNGPDADPFAKHGPQQGQIHPCRRTTPVGDPAVLLGIHPTLRQRRDQPLIIWIQGMDVTQA